MLDYYNEEIPDESGWKKIDEADRYSLSMVNLCSLIDDYIPQEIKLQEMCNINTAMESIKSNIKYPILDLFMNDLPTILIKNLTIWKTAWNTAVTIAINSSVYPSGVIFVNYFPQSTISFDFDVVSKKSYNDSMSIKIFGKALEKYVLANMLLNSTYRLIGTP